MRFLIIWIYFRLTSRVSLRTGLFWRRRFRTSTPCSPTTWPRASRRTSPSRASTPSIFFRPILIFQAHLIVVFFLGRWRRWWTFRTTAASASTTTTCSRWWSAPPSCSCTKCGTRAPPTWWASESTERVIFGRTLLRQLKYCHAKDFHRVKMG